MVVSSSLPIGDQFISFVTISCIKYQKWWRFSNLGVPAEALPDALQSECSKCSEKQKEGAKKVLTFLFKNKPEHFEKLEKKYDTNGVYRAKYSDLAKQEGIKA